MCMGTSSSYSMMYPSCRNLRTISPSAFCSRDPLLLPASNFTLSHRGPPPDGPTCTEDSIQDAGCRDSHHADYAVCGSVLVSERLDEVDSDGVATLGGCRGGGG